MNKNILIVLAACLVVVLVAVLIGTEEPQGSGAVGVPSGWYERGSIDRERDKELAVASLPDYSMHEVTGELPALEIARASLKKYQQGEYAEAIRLSIVSMAFMRYDLRRCKERDYFQVLQIMNRSIIDRSNPPIAQAFAELWDNDESRTGLKQSVLAVGPPTYELPFETTDSITARYEAMDQDSLWTVVVDQLFDVNASEK